MTPKEREEFYSRLDAVYNLGSPCSIESFLMEQVQHYAREYGETSDSCLTCLSELGSYYRGVSRYEEAIDIFRKTDRIIVDLFGGASAERSVNLNNMAGAYRMLGKTGEALELFLQAITICESLPERNSYIYASALNNTSLLFQLQEDYGKASEYMYASIKQLESLPDAKNELATACANLSFQLNRMGEKDKALELITKALDLFRGLPEKGDHYAAALNSKGVFAAEQGRYGEAKEAFLEALPVIKTVFGENADYGITCRNLARVLIKNREYPPAVSYLHNAKQIFSRVFGEGHPVTESVTKELNELELSLA
jgi:tetratricopeptide (TPR) repeat protein